MGNNFDYNANLNQAVYVPVIKNHKSESEHNKSLIQSSVGLFSLILDEHIYGVTPERHNKIKAHITTVTSAGLEPSGDLLHFWYYPILASAFAIAKRTPTIWNELTERQIEKIDLIMTVFALGSNFISNDENNYSTGISMKGDVHKNRPPNFRLSLIGPIIPCADYFGGADALDDIFTTFDYDAFIDRLENFGFVNMLNVWQTPTFEKDGQIYQGAKELLMNGGEAFIKEPMLGTFNIYSGGFGKGVRIPYKYHNFRADSMEMLNELLNYTYSGGEILSKFGMDAEGNAKTFIIDGSISPYEGMPGLMLEFNTQDSNFRSDANYCEIDFIMASALMLFAKVAGIWNEKDNKDLYTKIWNGSKDLMYKLKYGFKSFSLNHYHISVGTNIVGYNIMKEVFNEFFMDPSLI